MNYCLNDCTMVRTEFTRHLSGSQIIIDLYVSLHCPISNEESTSLAKISFHFLSQLVSPVCWRMYF